MYYTPARSFVLMSNSLKYVNYDIQTSLFKNILKD